MTKIYDMHEENPDPRKIMLASQDLNAGKVILCPTETGYCLLASCQSQTAHKKLATIKSPRSKDKPYSLLFQDIRQISLFTQISNSNYKLLNKYLPGPFTFLLEASKNAKKILTTKKRPVIGVRLSSHNIAKSLMTENTGPLIITSLTDEESLENKGYFNDQEQEDSWWTQAEDILDVYPNTIDSILSVKTPVPLKKSTIIDLTTQEPMIVRRGLECPEDLLLFKEQ